MLYVHYLGGSKDNILVSCGIGYCKSSSYKGISSDNQMNIYLILHNIYTKIILMLWWKYSILI